MNAFKQARDLAKLKSRIRWGDLPPEGRTAAPIGTLFLCSSAASPGLWLKVAGAATSTGWEAR